MLSSQNIDDLITKTRSWLQSDVADGNLSPETVRNYSADIQQHLLWLHAKNLDLNDVGLDDLESYPAWLTERYASSTVARKITAVRRFYDMAYTHRILSQNLASTLAVPRNQGERSTKITHLPPKMLRQILARPLEKYHDEHAAIGFRDHSILALMIMHGLCVIEVHRLSLADFDPDAGEYGALSICGMGDRKRLIALTAETRAVLDIWLNARALLHPDTDALYITMHWNGAHAPISRRGIRAMVDGYLADVGVKDAGISCHTLRHSYATLSLAAGASLLAVSTSLGHTNKTTTQVYAKIAENLRATNPSALLTGLLGQPTEG